MSETRDRGMKSFAEMWMGIPLEMYSRGQHSENQEQHFSGYEKYFEPWKHFMNSMDYSGFTDKNKSKANSQNTADDPVKKLDDVLKQARQLWGDAMNEGMKFWKKYQNNTMENFLSPNAYTRNSGAAGMEVLNEMFERLLNGNLFKKIGPARNFQHKMDQAMEKMAEFNVAAMEFYRYFSLPMESATKKMLHEIGKSGSDAMTPEGMKALYSKWLSNVEDQYAELFKAPSYLNALEFFVRSVSESRAAMLSINNDLYRQMGIASLEEMDDISLEIYRLKKKIKQLEKGQKNAASGAVGS